MIAVHFTSRHFDLKPVLQLIGWYFDMEAANIYSPGGRPSAYPADWMLLTTNRAFLKKSLIGYTRASVRQADSYLD